MTYKEARVYLDELSKYGSVLGLETIRELLDELGNPQNSLKFIHIAGTNGKGSVLAYTSTILSEAGYRTGRYTSPAVVSHLEQIQVDGEWISGDEFAELVEEVKDAIARMNARQKTSPTVFEVETAIAFLCFKKKKCDIVVLECGLGGRDDATNVIRNTLAAAFVSISMDHMGFLGDTLAEIAANKAGIIKPGCTVVSGIQKEEVLSVLKEIAAEKQCPMVLSRPDKVRILESSYKEQLFDYQEFDRLRIRLAGQHQIENALIAIEIVKSLNQKGFNISGNAVRNGLNKTSWPGRFSCIHEKPVFIVDGAHNADAAKRLQETVKACFPDKKLFLIMGMFKDKEYHEIAATLVPLADVIYTVSLPNEERTLGAEELKNICIQVQRKEAINQVFAIGSINRAVELALEHAGEEDVILACGSLSYLQRVIQAVEKRG